MAADDFIHMDTDLVEPVMHRLTGAGEDLDGTWTTCRAQVESGEAGIGDDMLGRAFRQGYDGPSATLRAGADPLPGSLRAAAASGMACCADYLAADTRAAAALPTGPA